MAEDKSGKKQLTKADTDAWFDARREKIAKRRKDPMTGERLAEETSRKRDERRSKRPEGAVARRISIGLGIALLVGAGGAALGTTTVLESLSAQSSANAATIAGIEGQLSDVPGTDEQSLKDLRAEVDAQVVAGTKKGEEVAALQQGFAGIFASTNDEQTADGAASALFLESVEHRRALEPYFVDAALVAGDLAYTAGSTDPFASDQIDPRFPWYVSSQIVREDGSSRMVYGPADTCTWTLVSVVGTETAGVLDATWLCQGAGDDLYAWASAKYYASEDKFGRVSVGSTTIGDNGGRTAGQEG